MYGTVTKSAEIFQRDVQSTAVDLHWINAEKWVLPYLPNLHEGTLEKQKKFFFHIILGADKEYGPRNDQSLVRIQVNIHDQVRNSQSFDGHCKENIFLCFLRWKEFFPLNLSQKEFEMLLQLDVLGLVEQPDSNSAFHEKFTSPLQKTEDGVYETRFPWKSACPNVPRSKHNSDLWCLSKPIQPGSSLQKLVSQYKSDYPET